MEKEIVEYEVEIASRLELLEEFVMKSISEGWQPIGGITYISEFGH